MRPAPAPLLQRGTARPDPGNVQRTPPLASGTANPADTTRPGIVQRGKPAPTQQSPSRPGRARPGSPPLLQRDPPQHRPTRHAPAPPTRQMRLAPAEPGPIPVVSNVTRPGPTRPRHRPTQPQPPTPAQHTRPRRARKKRVPEIRNPPYDSRSSANYFDNSASAALALSAAGPAVTFWKAAMACGFISLAL